MSFRDILSGSTSQLMKWIIALFAIGCVLLYSHFAYDFSNYGDLGLSVKSIIFGIGSSFIVACLVILVVDIALRKQMLNDMQRIFREEQKAKGIKFFVHERKALDNILADDISSAAPGTRIDVVGISQRNFLTDSPGHDVVVEKINMGCNFRILILHPASKLLLCYQNLSKSFGSPDLVLSMRASIIGNMKHVYEVLSENQMAIKGSIEVRLFRDVYSTIYLYSGNRITILGTYLAHKRGTLSPAFVVDDVELSKSLEQHFDCLWKHSADSVLYSISRDTNISNIDDYFAVMGSN